MTAPGRRNEVEASRRLALIRDRREQDKSLEVMAVDACRAAGMSWEKIGRVLGVTGSAAAQRFRRHVRY